MKNKCFFCGSDIEPAELNLHHYPRLKSEGGTSTVAVHTRCHRAEHAEDFRRFGRKGGLKSAQTFKWVFNLKHVKTHPAYENYRTPR